MNHPNEGALLALIDGELDAPSEAALREHLARCEPCRAELQTLRNDTMELSGALRLLDRAPPVGRAWQGVAVRRVRRAAVPLRRAAALLLVAGGALSATVPGSPVRGWTADAWRQLAGSPEPEPEAAVTRPAPPPPAVRDADPAPAGVAVVAGERPMQLRITSPGGRPEIRVRLHDGERLEVEVFGAEHAPRFRTSTDRIEVLGAGDRVRVAAPRRGHLTLEVNGEPYLTQDGDRFRFPGPAADDSAAEVVFGARR